MSDSKLGIYEAKTNLAKLISRVENGDTITITRHGKAVARLVPVIEEQQRSKDSAVQSLRTFHQGRSLDDLSIREMIEEGRR